MVNIMAYLCSDGFIKDTILKDFVMSKKINDKAWKMINNSIDNQ